MAQYCFAFYSNVKGFGSKHKRVYRIYCELELNLHIKPKKRLRRDRPGPLSVPDSPIQVWSMDFMADQLWNRKSLRTLNVLDDIKEVVLDFRPVCSLVKMDHGFI